MWKIVLYIIGYLVIGLIISCESIGNRTELKPKDVAWILFWPIIIAFYIVAGIVCLIGAGLYGLLEIVSEPFESKPKDTNTDVFTDVTIKKK